METQSRETEQLPDKILCMSLNFLKQFKIKTYFLINSLDQSNTERKRETLTLQVLTRYGRRLNMRLEAGMQCRQTILPNSHVYGPFQSALCMQPLKNILIPAFCLNA